jgi:hypothetical protein
MGDEWRMGELPKQRFVTVDISTDYDCPCPVKGDWTVESLSPFSAGEGNKLQVCKLAVLGENILPQG